MGVRVLVLLSALESRRRNKTNKPGDAEERSARDLGRRDGERGKRMEMEEQKRDD